MYIDIFICSNVLLHFQTIQFNWRLAIVELFWDMYQFRYLRVKLYLRGDITSQYVYMIRSILLYLRKIRICLKCFAFSIFRIASSFSSWFHAFRLWPLLWLVSLFDFWFVFQKVYSGIICSLIQKKHIGVFI